MITKIKHILTSEEHKGLLSNIFSLSILQIFTYILPLITLPYLVRVLGVEKFGLVIFAQSCVLFLNVLVDYGFVLSATRDISIHRNDKDKVTEIFSSVMVIKAIFVLLAFIAFSIIIFSFEKFSKDWQLYYLTFLWIVGQAMFPVWYFQGIERMKYVTIVNVASKLLFTIAIFIFIQKESDYIYVPLLNGLGATTGGAVSLWLIYKKFNQSINFSLVNLKKHTKQGFDIFIAEVSMALYGVGNAIILGLFVNNTAVGYYSMAEKIMRALAMLQVPVINALFPHMAQLIKTNKALAIIRLKTIIKFGTITYTCILLLSAIFANKLLTIIYGQHGNESVLVFQIISFVPLLMFLQSIFGKQIMLNLNKEKDFAKILFLGAAVNIILCCIFSVYFSYIGAASALIIAEILIASGMFLSIRKDLNEYGKQK